MTENVGGSIHRLLFLPGESGRETGEFYVQPYGLTRRRRASIASAGRGIERGSFSAANERGSRMTTAAWAEPPAASTASSPPWLAPARGCRTRRA
jgi:hypothetical protein